MDYPPNHAATGAVGHPGNIAQKGKTIFTEIFIALCFGVFTFLI